MHCSQGQRKFGRAPRARLLLGLFALAGCVQGPDAGSGPDAYRHQAEPMELDQWIPDSLSSGGNDQVDWRQFTVAYASEIVVTVVFDNEQVEAEVGLYDRYGIAVKEDAKSRSDSPRLIVRGLVPAGTNFVRVAVGSRQETGYTIQVQVADSQFPAPPT
jgi:hypothetical protein